MILQNYLKILLKLKKDGQKGEKTRKLAKVDELTEAIEDKNTIKQPEKLKKK